MLRYSGDWRGKVVFIVCRNEPNKAFSTHVSELLKEKGMCLLVITDQHIEQMLTLKHQGSDPTSVIETLFRERIESS